MAGEEHRDLVICNRCLWAASLLKGSSGFSICPLCGSQKLEVIPVNDYESHKMSITEKGSVEIQFRKE
jgi:hypothetical protein